MKAIRFENQNLNLAEVPVPAPENETVIRVMRSGICSTDLEIVRGYAGFSGTLGHEFVGIVERSPDTPALAGKRIVGEINVGCGLCELCRGNDSRHCANRTVLGISGRDGAHAEFVSLPSVNLLEVPVEVSDVQAVFVEPLAAALGIAERAKISEETCIGVIGDGKLGNLCAQALRLTSRDITMIGKHKNKLALIEKCGIEGVPVEKAIKTMSRKFDLIVEASGSESGFDLALELIKPRGQLVLKSTFHGMPRWAASKVVVDEITIIGSRCGRFSPALEVLKQGLVNVENLVSDEFSLSDGVAAFRRAGQQGVMKVLLSNR